MDFLMGSSLLLIWLVKNLLPTILIIVAVCYVVNKLNQYEDLNKTKKSAQTLWYLTGAMYFLKKLMKGKW